MFMTVVFNPLAPEAELDAINLRAQPHHPPSPRAPLYDKPGTRFPAGALRQPRNQLATLTTDPDR